MRAAILLNRGHEQLRTLGKQVLARGYELVRGRGLGHGPLVLPEFDALPRILDPEPLVLGTEAPIDWAALARCDVLFWEWGWTDVPPRRLLEVRRRADVPTIVFPGPLDRFWREVDPAHVPLHFEALRATDGIGVMLRDTIGFYAALAPAAVVFHLPVPVDVERFTAVAVPLGERDDRVLLSAPTRFCGPASQLPISTHLVFRRLRERHPRLEGVCFCYDDEERRQAEVVLRELGLAGVVEIRSYVRPLGRFLDQARHCRLAITLPQAVIQGRTALMAACLGIPVVASGEIETHRTLFPHTTVAWHDVEGATAHACRLLEDPAFAAQVSSTARGAVEDYGLDATRERLESALGEIHVRRRLREGA